MIDVAVMRGCARRAERLVRALQARQRILDRLLRPLPAVLPTAASLSTLSVQAPVDTSDDAVLAYAVAQRIRFERTRRRWTQEELASRTGIARPNVARLERGIHLPAMATLRRVAAALSLDLDALMRAPSVEAGEREEDRDLVEAGMADWSAQLADEDAE
jgi:transcriptional regulator with XRE-family HTH domain